jgi:Histidine kinase
MKKIFIHNSLFRLIVPVLYGILVYVLVLLIFDSITQLTQNFFSFEVLLCILISYNLSEFMRLVIQILDRTCQKKSLSYRIIIQFLINGAITILLTSLIITGYYVYLVGFKKFNTELFVFNSLFLISSIFYNAIYFSIYFLNRTNEIRLLKEKSLKEKTISELEDYKNKINPEFLYASLETLISLSKKNTESADEFINKLSMVYRSVLSSKRNEVISVQKDIESAKNLVSILNYKYNHNINLVLENEDLFNGEQVIPGTFIFIIQRIVQNSIISEIQSLKISIKKKKDNLLVFHKINDKLITDFKHSKELENLQKAYAFVSNGQFNLSEEDNVRYFHIPTIKLSNHESTDY